MAEKPYEWIQGATLEEHSRRKHKILSEYFAEYLAVRCQRPQQEKFRLAIVDGFAGGGRYSCGSLGSPLIFIQELGKTTAAINARRAVKGFSLVQIECLLIFNDASKDAISVLRENVAPVLAEALEASAMLHLHVEYMTEPFEMAYPDIKRLLTQGRYASVIFNLDQCGHSRVDRETLIDIMRSHPSAEIFYTFAIQALLSFLQQRDPVRLTRQLQPFGITSDDMEVLTGGISKGSWLGAAERLVFDTFKACAPFGSPFSIHNPDGWRYWFIHFANSYRARQVYNNVLHRNSTTQAHFGRSGLDMLAYDPSHEDGNLYLFDMNGREQARDELMSDIPRLISGSGDALDVGSFYEAIYNATPSHADDIHGSIILNPDIQVITKAGGERRTAHSIRPDDILKLRPQKSFSFPMFFDASKRL